mgnify:CR=1 FL=1
MKRTIYVFVILSITSLIFNVYKIDWDKSLIQENSIALIGILASASALIILLILRISIKISEKQK